MTTEPHRLSKINLETKTAFCSAHKKTVKIERRNKTSSGKDNWRCVRIRRRGYRIHKTNVCEKCNFEGHISQFDIDHIDGNHKNNNLKNLMTLCANCHRLKTWYERQKPLPL